MSVHVRPRIVRSLQITGLSILTTCTLIACGIAPILFDWMTLPRILLELAAASGLACVWLWFGRSRERLAEARRSERPIPGTMPADRPDRSASSTASMPPGAPSLAESVRRLSLQSRLLSAELCANACALDGSQHDLIMVAQQIDDLGQLGTASNFDELAADRALEGTHGTSPQDWARQARTLLERATALAKAVDVVRTN